MRHRAGVFGTIVAATAAGIVAVAAPAAAAVPGFDVRITELPDTFAAGGAPDTVTVVASTDTGRGCQRVRWSMVMRVEGVRLDQVKVDRIEDTGSFPLLVRAGGDTARLTDARLDPGTLCRGRTVTARYQVAFAGTAGEGRVTFQAEAYDAQERLLEQASATSQVTDEGSPPARETRPTTEPTVDPSDDADDGSATDEDANPEETSGPEETGGPEETAGPDGTGAPGGAANDPTAPSAGGIAAVPASSGGNPGLVGAGLIVGAVLIFLGVGLLLRLRMRGRKPERHAMTAPFHPAG